MRCVTIDFICTYFTSLHWNIYDSAWVIKYYNILYYNYYNTINLKIVNNFSAEI